MITIIDYNMGNIASIENMLKKIGVEAIVSSDPDVIANAEKIILPGVGSFDYGMNSLNNMGIAKVLSERVFEQHIPHFGYMFGDATSYEKQ